MAPILSLSFTVPETKFRECKFTPFSHYLYINMFIFLHFYDIGEILFSHHIIIHKIKSNSFGETPFR